MQTPSNQSAQISLGSIGEQIARDTTVHMNVEQNALIITEDKIRIVLMTHLTRLEERRAWIAPVGLVVALFTTFVTSTFHDFVLKAATWEAIFALSLVGSFLWSVYAIVKATKAPKVDDVITQMKQDSRKGA